MCSASYGDYLPLVCIAYSWYDLQGTIRRCPDRDADHHHQQGEHEIAASRRGPAVTPTTARSQREYLSTLRRRARTLGSEVGTFGPRSVPGDLRREHLLICATIAFVEVGFEGTSMHAIAESAGVTKPVIYALFPSKEDLFAAVVDRVNDELAVELEGAVAERGESQLAPGIRAYLQYVRTRSALWGQLLTSIHHVPVGDAARRLRDRQVAIVVSALRRGYEDAGLPVEPWQLEALAHFVSGAVDAVSNWWATQPDIDLDTVADFLTQATSPAVAAIRAEGAPAVTAPSRRRR